MINHKSFSTVTGLLLVLAGFSCHNEMKEKPITVSTDTANTAFPKQSQHSASEISGDTCNIQNIMNSIVKGDKQRFASLCRYPIERDYPLPDIENAEQMVEYFDTLFDRSYRRELAKETTDDKVNHGWRGYSLNKETLWIYDSLYAVHYSSPKEKRKLNRLRNKEMQTLNTKMRGKGWKPYACYKDITDNAYIRIDAKGAYDFRLAIYNTGLKASDLPKTIKYGKLSDNWGRVSSEDGHMTAFREPSLCFYFGKGKDCVCIYASVFIYNEDGTVDMFWENDESKKSHRLKPCYWLDEIKKNIAVR